MHLSTFANIKTSQQGTSQHFFGRCSCLITMVFQVIMFNLQIQQAIMFCRFEKNLNIQGQLFYQIPVSLHVRYVAMGPRDRHSNHGVWEFIERILYY